MGEVKHLRTLTLRESSRPGRPAHVSAASGIVRVGERLYVVADDENHLAVFAANGTEPGTLARVFAGTLPVEARARKRSKADLECIARLPSFDEHPDGALLALGSCSRRERCSGVLLGLDATGELDGRRAIVDLSPLYEAFKTSFGRLNIEGALVLGEQLVLLHRGNKGDRRNAVMRFHLETVLEALLAKGEFVSGAVVAVNELPLGAVGDVPYGFTDGAALPDGRIAFTAIAEDTSDSYSDGPCRGALLGIIGSKGAIEWIEPIDPRYKVEGIDVVVENNTLQALLVTDADDAEIAASLLSVEMRG